VDGRTPEHDVIGLRQVDGMAPGRLNLQGSTTRALPYLLMY
jgi:hypothetical protein